MPSTDRLAPMRSLLTVTCLMGMLLLAPVAASAAITVTPSTWNVFGLDSNSPAFGPYRFPVGAKVCSNTAETNVIVNFNWDAGGTDNGTFIYLRPGSNSSLTIPNIAAGTCADAFFEVELNRTSAAYDQTRRYYISANGVSTPRPRELKVERLVSQSRNAITSIEFGTSLSSLTSVPNGGSFDLAVGNTYYIRMSGYTATQGYEQLESFVNFPNTIFQVLSVSSTYSADTSPIVNSPNPGLYADSCGWDSDPTSPSYLSCTVSGKAGGVVTVTYQVKILSKGSGRESLNSLIHDFSGSSYHYNADFSTSARFVNLVDPTTVTIAKSFSPDPVNSNGVSTLTISLYNPNGGAVGDISVADVFPTAPAAMTVAAPLTVSNSCGGSLLDSGGGSLNAGDPGFRLSGAGLPAYGSCSVKVNVTAPVPGTYTNTTAKLFVTGVDTGKTATDTLTFDDNAVPPPPPAPSACPTPIELARWTMDSTQGTATPPVYFTKAADVATATAGFSGTGNAIGTTLGNPANNWNGTGWAQTTGTSTFNSPAYFEFALDTRKYGGVRMDFDYYMGAAGDWKANNNNNIYVYSRADSGAFATALSAAAGNKGNWYSTAANATVSGTNTTTFRINADTAGNANAIVYLDNIVFTGCRAPDPPTIAKGFAPTTIAVNGTSTLTFTVANPNPAVSLTGIAFTDTLPAGLTVTSGSSSVCGGTLTMTAPNQIAFAGGTLAGGTSCNITATVTAAAAGTHDNISGLVSATQTGANTTATGSARATLTAVLPPSITKKFNPNPIFTKAFGEISTLTFTIANPNTAYALNGVAFTDTLPAGVVVASPSGVTTIGCGTPTFAPAAGTGSISFSSASIASGAICTASVAVDAVSAGTYINTSGPVSHLLNGTWNGNAATDTLLVEQPAPEIALLKQVAPSAAGPWSSYLAVATGGNVYYRFTAENLGDVNLSSVNVTDPAPYLNLASCTWEDGDDNPLTAPFTLPVADADNGHLAVCVLGPVTAEPGPHPNTATATGTFGPTTVTDTSTASYATTALTLDKTADKSYYLASGETINYSYAINNSGARLDGPLTITVTDNRIGSVTCPALTTIGNNDPNFDTGETLVCAASYTVTASDLIAEQITNIARANIRDGGILNINTPQDTLTVPAGPDLVVTKTNSAGGAAATNVPFNWVLTVQNTTSMGLTATFTNGQRLLIDKLPNGPVYSTPAVATSTGGTTGTISCAIAADTLTCTATGSVAIPPDGGFNVAVTTTPSAPGTLANPSGGICRIDPDGIVAEISDANNDCTDTVTVTTPAVTLVKTASRSYFLAVGDLLAFTYKVKNTGATPIAGPVTVTDDKTTVACPAVTIIGDLDADLDPGEELTCTSAYTIQAADVTVGQVTNVAIATVGTGGTAVNSPRVSLTVPIGPDLDVTKTSDLTGVASPGIPFNWTLTATNSAAAGYPAAFTTGQRLLTDDLPAGPVYSVPATATNTGNTTGTITCAIAAGTLTCTAGDDVSIPPGGGFAIAVTTTPATGGSLVNPRDAGICRVDPAALIVEISDSNNDCADTVSVGLPLLAVIKSSDRATATPGDLINYTLVISNFGPVIARDIKVDDFMGRFTAIRLNPWGNGTPFSFTPQTSGLAVQSIEYSNDTDPSDGITFGYTPADPDGDGIDDSITRWRITMGGDMQPAPSQFTLRYQSQVK